MLLLVFTYTDINKNYKVLIMIDWRRGEGGGVESVVLVFDYLYN